MSPQPRVVVVGGGYAGVFFVRNFESRNFPVTLIERNECFFHKIGGAKAAIVEGYEKLMVKSYSKLLINKKSKFVQGFAKKINLESDSVIVQEIDGKEMVVEFDYLVIAIGLKHKFGQLPSDLDNRCLSEKDMLKFLVSEQERVKKYDKYVVIGGGALGVEVSAQLKCSYPEKDVELYHSRAKLLSNCVPPLSDEFDVILKQKLQRIGVVLHTNERYMAKSGDHDKSEANVLVLNVAGFTIENDKQLDEAIKTENLLPPEFYDFNTGEILTDKYMMLRNHSKNNIFVLGDVAKIDSVEEYKQGRWAFMHSRIAKTNILKLHNAKASPGKLVSLAEYRPFKEVPWIATLFSYFVFFMIRKRVKSSAFIGLWLGDQGGISEAFGLILKDYFMKGYYRADKGASAVDKYLRLK